MKRHIVSFGIYSPLNSEDSSFLRELGNDIPFMSDSTLDAMRLNCSEAVAHMIDRELASRYQTADTDYDVPCDEDDVYDDKVLDDDFRPYGEDDNPM